MSRLRWVRPRVWSMYLRSWQLDGAAHAGFLILIGLDDVALQSLRPQGRAPGQTPGGEILTSIVWGVP